MKAVILAAGKGTRLRPLTLKTPKPLLKVGGRCLIDYLLERLASAGVHEAFINVHHLGEQIQHHVGKGTKWGLEVTWFSEQVLLDTGGALRAMLPALGAEPCMVLSADVWMDYPIDCLLALNLDGCDLHLVMVPNPPFHPEGDFDFRKPGTTRGLLQARTGSGYNYGGYAVIRPELIGRESQDIFPLRRLMDLALAENRISGELWEGDWFNIGTTADLEALRARVDRAT